MTYLVPTDYVCWLSLTGLAKQIETAGRQRYQAQNLIQVLPQVL